MIATYEFREMTLRERNFRLERETFVSMGVTKMSTLGGERQAIRVIGVWEGPTMMDGSSSVAREVGEGNGSGAYVVAREKGSHRLTGRSRVPP